MATHFPLLGFRWWWLGRLRDGVWGHDSGTLQLHSWNRPTLWPLVPGGILNADHVPVRDKLSCRQKDPAPEDGCHCGIYAWRDIEQAWNGIQRYATGWRTKLPAMPGLKASAVEDHVDVAGVIVAGGVVRVHGDEGFRCAQAQIVALAVDDRTLAHSWISEAAHQLQVPIMLKSQLKRYSTEFGRLVP